MHLNSASKRDVSFSALQPTMRRIGAMCGCVLVCAVTMGSSPAQAQAFATSSRPYNLSTFATGGILNTDYSVKDKAVSAGTDLTRYFHLVQPSFEIRGTASTGDVIRQKTLSAGVKLEKGFGAFHPYANLLYGYGVISYPQSTIYPRDNSSVWTYGGGLDYRVSQSFMLKAEIQQQSWKLGITDPRFEPTLMTVGFSYQPFNRHTVR